MKKTKKTPPHHSPVQAAKRSPDRGPAGPPPLLQRRMNLGLLFLILAGFVVVARQFDFLQDDAYITFRYVKNLIEGNGLVFNIGERVEGYTTFLWTILIAVPMKLGLDVAAVSRYLGIMFSLGTIALLSPISAVLDPGPRPAGFRLIAPLLLAACGAFAYWTVSGMETAMFSFLVVLAVWTYLRERNRREGFAWTPLVYVALSLTRPEGMFLFGLMGLHRLAELAIAPRDQRFHGIKRLLIWMLWFAVPIGLFTLWRLAYYGYLFPNTYYAKAGFSSEYLAAGWEYLLAYARNYLFGGWMFVIPLAVLLWRKRTSEILYLVGLVIAYGGYIVTVGGDVLHAHRFFLAIAPLIYLLVQECLVALYAMVRGPRFLARLAVYGVAAFLAFSTYKYPLAQLQDVGAKEAGLVERMSGLGQWIARNSPPGSVMAASTIGAISYYGGITLVDMLGLTDATIAHNPEYIGGVKSVWRERKYNVSYVLSRTPIWICFSTGPKPSAFAERALFTRSDFRRWYYPYYFHPTGDANYVDVMYRRADTPLPLCEDTSRVDNDFINLYYDGVNRVSRWPADALTLFARAESIAPPDFGMLHQMMAEALYRLRRPTEAERHDSLAVAADPRLVESQRRLGYQALQRNDIVTARRHFETMTHYQPAYAETWLDLGQAALAQQDTVAARASFLRALQVAPNLTAATGMLQRLRSAGGF